MGSRQVVVANGLLHLKAAAGQRYTSGHGRWQKGKEEKATGRRHGEQPGAKLPQHIGL